MVISRDLIYNTNGVLVLVRFHRSSSQPKDQSVLCGCRAVVIGLGGYVSIRLRQRASTQLWFLGLILRVVCTLLTMSTQQSFRADSRIIASLLDSDTSSTGISCRSIRS